MPIGNHRGAMTAPWKGAQPPWQRTLPSSTTRKSDAQIGFQRALDLHDLKGDALLEQAAKQHNFGQWVKHFYHHWKDLGYDTPARNPEDSLTKFAEWLDAALKNPKADPKVARILAEEVEFSTNLTIKQFDTTKHNLTKVQRFLEGVKYICKEADRIKYLVRARSGQLFRRQELFDTYYHSTVFSGTDWAIWVRAPNGNFYSHSHKVARFHHSSFLAGGMVLGAGEWSVTCGKIKKISGKSGHYQAGMKALWESAHALHALGVFHRQATVILYKRDSLCATAVPLGKFLATSWQDTLQDWIVDRHSKEPKPAVKITPSPAPLAPAASITPAPTSAVGNNDYDEYGEDNQYLG